MHRIYRTGFKSVTVLWRLRNCRDIIIIIIIITTVVTVKVKDSVSPPSSEYTPLLCSR